MRLFAEEKGLLSTPLKSGHTTAAYSVATCCSAAFQLMRLKKIQVSGERSAQCFEEQVRAVFRWSAFIMEVDTQSRRTIVSYKQTRTYS